MAVVKHAGRGARDLYVDELRFLLRLKESIGLLNNRIHDRLALVAIEWLRPKHPDLDLSYTGAGGAGIDIRGFDARKVLRLVAEVKTTLPDAKGRIRGPQKAAIQKDLDRLRDTRGDVARYLIVLSPGTKDAVERQLGIATHYPTVQVMNALDVEFVETTADE